MRETTTGKLLDRKRESKRLDFKERFNPEERGDWCELMKDIVAMANGGGGVVLIGLRDDGTPSGHDVQAVLSLDHAQIMDQIKKYCGTQMIDLTVEEAVKLDNAIAILRIGPVKCPTVFVRPGIYSVEGGRQKTAFAQGTVYFRHGAKSEPAEPEDLEEFMQSELSRRSATLMADVRKVVEAPIGHQVVVVPEATAAAISIHAVMADAVPPDAAVIAIEDPQRFCTLTFTDVATQTGIRGNNLIAVMRELGVREDARMAYEFRYGKSIIWKYSDAAVSKIRKAAPSMDIRAVYRKHFQRGS